MCQPISGHPQVHSWSEQHTEEEMFGCVWISI